MAERQVVRRSRSRRRTTHAGSLLAVAAGVASVEFRDDDPGRTREVMAHLWWNSGLRERRFCALLQEARRITKARMASGEVQLGEPGRRRATPYFVAVLRDLLAATAGAQG